jgi:hypothetical protein
MFGFLKDIVETTTAPFKIASEATRVITKPLSDVSKEAIKEVKEAVKDITE